MRLKNNISLLALLLFAAWLQAQQKDCVAEFRAIKDAYAKLDSYVLKGTINAYSTENKTKKIDEQKYVYTKYAEGFSYQFGPVKCIYDKHYMIKIDTENKLVYVQKNKDGLKKLKEANDQYNFLIENIRRAVKANYKVDCIDISAAKAVFNISAPQAGNIENLKFYFNKSTYYVDKLEMKGLDGETGNPYWMDCIFSLQLLNPSSVPSILTSGDVVTKVGSKILLSKAYSDYQLIESGR